MTKKSILLLLASLLIFSLACDLGSLPFLMAAATPTSTPLPPTPEPIPTATEKPAPAPVSYYGVWQFTSSNGCTGTKETTFTRPDETAIVGEVHESYSADCNFAQTDYYFDISEGYPLYAYPVGEPDGELIILGQQLSVFSNEYIVDNGDGCQWTFTDIFDVITGFLVQRTGRLDCASGLIQQNLEVLVDANVPLGIGW